ncbi:MotA/TolQ/ExbB proton channel family protein [Planctomicrobium sp. SH664]|uniref:MotA/TolQ/ExbB proton channel family protein n=1 Tax=Planctomicrobium sp. SH664 TaxID=3448125 RepID=UPI003F5B8A8B
MDRRTHLCLLLTAVLLTVPQALPAQAPGPGNSPATSPSSPNATEAPGQPSATAGEKPATPGRSIPTNIIQMAQALGIWIFPFAIATLVAVWCTTERLVVLRRGRVIPRPFVQRFLRLLEDGQLNREEALQICEENGSPVASIFAHGVRKWGKPSVEVEQAIIDGGERQISLLRKHLRLINGVATLAPLLGLLGTVWGMLESFDRIASAGAMGRTEDLASGIALALVTTATGLGIAIPSLAVYMYLAGRIDTLVTEMDELGQKVVNAISGEALSERTTRPRKLAKDKEEGTQKRAI